MTSSASPFDRRAVSRALTRVARMDVDELLREPVHDGPPAPRIGITGAPGVGKSSLIARLAHVRVEKASPLAIVAIDPTSPDSAGSLLGDRIRMEALAEDPRVYVRSMPSGQTRDGLGDNLPEVLSTLDSFGFAEIVVETVGVGQAEFGVRELVDVEVLLLMPGLGDSIQAMKAGILETADLIVINKADLAGARRTALELKTTLSQRRGVAVPHIVLVKADDDEGLLELDARIDEALHQALERRPAPARRRRFNRYRLQRLAYRKLAATLAQWPEERFDDEPAALYEEILATMSRGTDRRN
ncbi:MAG TPA: GTP-binding protein [Zeimonas sp.]|nr:GTP-binding protein [Zeimonas sp.]